jgi:hypothetical protein
LTPAGGGAGVTSAPAGNKGGAGADAGTLNACDFLTAAQIQGAVGFPVGPGKLQQSKGQADCEWTGTADDGKTVGLTIANFDQTLFQAGQSAGVSKPVPGIGEAAFKGWPHAGDLTIEFKGYQVTLAIINFQATNDKVDAENVTLANLVLPKL